MYRYLYKLFIFYYCDMNILIKSYLFFRCTLFDSYIDNINK